MEYPNFSSCEPNQKPSLVCELYTINIKKNIFIDLINLFVFHHLVEKDSDEVRESPVETIK